MSQEKLNPATGYVHDDSQVEIAHPDLTGYIQIESVDELPAEEKASE